VPDPPPDGQVALRIEFAGVEDARHLRYGFAIFADGELWAENGGIVRGDKHRARGEYAGLYLALGRVLAHFDRFESLDIAGDSQTVIQQLRGAWKAKGMKDALGFTLYKLREAQRRCDERPTITLYSPGQNARANRLARGAARGL